METKSIGKTLVRVFGILAVVASIGLVTYTLIARHIQQAHVDAIIMDSLEILSLISIAVYCAFGFTKKAASFYKLFICVFAISELVNIYGLSNGNFGVAALLPQSIIFGMLCILGFATDLGKTKSLIFGLIALLASVVALIVCVINNINDFWAGTVHCIANTAMCTVLLLMILAKYYDKAERGTK